MHKELGGCLAHAKRSIQSIYYLYIFLHTATWTEFNPDYFFFPVQIKSNQSKVYRCQKIYVTATQGMEGVIALFY